MTESEKNFKALFEIIESIPARKRTITVETEERDKNFRDVLMHLYEWHAMLERWYREGMSGDKSFRVEAYTRSDNLAMRKTLSSCRFVKEGYLRQAWENDDGSISDSICYAMIRDDWLSN